jgi:hypothetical protein
MKIDIFEDEKIKEDFTAEIPFDESIGTFKALKSFLPLISHDIPISEADNIVIQDLTKKNIEK